MAVRYAENLTLFRSATGRDSVREMKDRKKKTEVRIRKESTTKICPVRRILIIVYGDNQKEG